MKIYLACPYNHKEPLVREMRFHLANKKALELMNEGHIVFSPISHSFPIEKMSRERHDLEFWLKQDLSFIEDWADEVWVLCLKGWEQSLGIMEEVQFAGSLGIPVKWITMKHH